MPPRFLLGNLSDFNPSVDAVPYQQLPAVDRWLLSSHARLMAEVTAAYESYQVSRHTHIQPLCSEYITIKHKMPVAYIIMHSVTHLVMSLPRPFTYHCITCRVENG